MGTFTTVNGTQEYTVTNKLTANGSATDEQIKIFSTGTIQVVPASSIAINFLRCNIFIKDPVPAAQWFNIQDASISYNGSDGNRFSTTSQVNFEDCQVVFNGSSIAAIFLSDCINTRIFNAGSTMLTYTQEGANLNNMHLENSNWEVNGQPSEASNIKLVNSAMTNFLVPRLDFSYIDLSTGGNNLTMATGNGGVLACNFWNITLFDNTKVQHQEVGNKYYDGCSASWLFQDRDLATPVEDILIINSSDKSGSMTELGRYTTNSSGLTVGTYDSRFETTGANQVRDALFLFENFSDQSGSDFTNGGNSYSIVPVVNQIEIRSYLHEAPAGFIVGDDYLLGEQGSISSDYSTDVPLIFTMNNDLNITETNTATVLAYTDLGDPLKLYDRHKIEWRDNDGYALVKRVGKQLDLSTINLTLDATAGSVYVANSTDITAKAAVFTGGIPSIIGSFTVVNGALLNGGTFDDDVNYFSGPSTITDVTVTSGNTMDFNTTGSYIIDGGSIANVTGSVSGIVLDLINGATIASNGSPSNITIQNLVSIKVTAVDALGAPIEGARVYVEAGSGGPIAQGTVLANALTNASGFVENPAFDYQGDQPLQNSRVRKGTTAPYYITGIISGTITSAGLDLTVTMISDD
jgi:hypothetical protein